MLGGVYSIRKNNVSGPLAHNINKDQFLMNCRSEHTGKTYKLIEETENIKSYHTHRKAPGPEEFTNEFHHPFKEPDSI